MGAHLLHKNEWCLVLVLLVILLSFRIDTAVKNWRTRAKTGEEQDYYKNAHQVELVKEWVTSQYCKTDLEILCPEELSSSSCYAAFDPPLRFALDLSSDEKDKTIENCSIRELIDHTKWTDKEDVNDLKEDELLTYFIAHILDQVRSKSGQYFRAEDRSIQEYEQSRLIESTLASVAHLFASPTKVDKDGRTVSTTATEYGITKRVWTREETIALMHEAVFWHTHHKRHGSSSAGAAAHLSRQQPSFLFKFLPLVKEQIQNLELDDALDSRYQKLYPFPKLLSPDTITLDSDRPQSDQCLWSHFEAGSLISQDCMLALETAPLKIRDLDWEGDFSLLLIHIYTCFSGAFALWLISRTRRRHDTRRSDGGGSPQEMEVQAISNRSLKAISNRSLQAIAEAEERKTDQIRRAKWTGVAYLGFSMLLACVSSSKSETIQFSDFMDGMCLVLLGFLISLTPILTLGSRNQSMVTADEKRKMLLDPAKNKHYKKLNSIEFSYDKL